MSDQSKDLGLGLAWACLLVSGALLLVGIVLIVVALAARVVNFIPNWLSLVMVGCGVIALIVGRMFWRRATR